MTSVTTNAELSLSELRMLALKAARGAGMSWGLAEEAGFATEWLTARGLPGGAWLAALLQRTGDGVSAWPAAVRSNGPHCPIITGATLADHALISGGDALPRELRLRAVSSAGLLLPFVARLAALRNGAVTVGTGDSRITVSSDPQSQKIGEAQIWIGEALDVTLTIGDACRGGVPAPSPISYGRAILSMADLGCLNELASRLTVPATTRSRGDAGSATSDND